MRTRNFSPSNHSERRYVLFDGYLPSDTEGALIKFGKVEAESEWSESNELSSKRRQ